MVSIRAIRLRCPYCHEAIKPIDVKAGCNACMAWHHADCLAEHGRCASCSHGAPSRRGRSKGSVVAKQFSSNWESWQSLFDKVAKFATRVGRDSLLSISHSHRNTEGLVTVWYRGGTVVRRPGRLQFRLFQSSWRSWDSLFSDASRFASSLKSPDALVSMSHSAQDSEGVIAVWYWA